MADRPPIPRTDEQARQLAIRLHKEWRALAQRAGTAKREAERTKDQLIESLINLKGISREVDMALTKVAVDSRLHPERYVRKA